MRKLHVNKQSQRKIWLISTRTCVCVAQEGFLPPSKVVASGPVQFRCQSMSTLNLSINFHLTRMFCTCIRECARLCNVHPYAAGERYRHFLTIFYVCPIFFIDFSGARCLSDLMFFLRYWDIDSTSLVFVYFRLVLTVHTVVVSSSFCYEQTETPNNNDKRPKSKADLIAMVNARKSELIAIIYSIAGKKIRDFINLISASVLTWKTLKYWGES